MAIGWNGPSQCSRSNGCRLVNQPISPKQSSYCSQDFERRSNCMAIIRRAIFPDDLTSVLNIWREFIANSPVNLDYQDNDAEFAKLPSKYVAPDGCVLLADHGCAVDGCIAFRKVSHEICEMKRLYVRPQARGRDLGRDLVDRLIMEARSVGYREMRLDVMGQYLSARKLYEAFGFAAAEPISYNPEPGALFLGLRL